MFREEGAHSVSTSQPPAPGLDPAGAERAWSRMWQRLLDDTEIDALLDLAHCPVEEPKAPWWPIMGPGCGRYQRTQAARDGKPDGPPWKLDPDGG